VLADEPDAIQTRLAEYSVAAAPIARWGPRRLLDEQHVRAGRGDGLAATVVCAEPPARTASLATLLPRRGPRESGQPVIEWNQVLLGIVRTPGAQPSTVHPTRSFAIVHAAIYDAVNAIDRSRQPYRIFVSAPRGASETAAADAAAHAALSGCIRPSPRCLTAIMRRCSRRCPTARARMWNPRR
jgi:hypothetical protein